MPQNANARKASTDVRVTVGADTALIAINLAIFAGVFADLANLADLLTALNLAFVALFAVATLTTLFLSEPARRATFAAEGTKTRGQRALIWASNSGYLASLILIGLHLPALAYAAAACVTHVLRTRARYARAEDAGSENAGAENAGAQDAGT